IHQRGARQDAKELITRKSTLLDGGKSPSANSPAVVVTRSVAGVPKTSTNRTLFPTPFLNEGKAGIPPAFSAFNSWAQKYLAATTAEGRQALLGEGEALGKTRRDTLANLIKTNPKLALSLAASWKLRNDLPPAITALLEERISGRGDFEVFASVPLPGRSDGAASITRQVTLHGKSYEAYVYGQRTHQTTRGNISLHGIAIDKAMAVHEDAIRVLEPEEARAMLEAGDIPQEAICAVSGQSSKSLAQPTLVDHGGQILSLCRPEHATELNRQLIMAEGGPTVAGNSPPPPQPPPGGGSWSQSAKTLLYMRVIFPDDATEPITEAGANATMNQVNAYFVEASYDTTSIISTITPLLRLPQVKLWYGTNGPGALQLDARLAAKAAG